jgi:hypothetical protein
MKMIERHTDTITAAFEERGLESFLTVRDIVVFILDQLSALVLSGASVTEGEIDQMAAITAALERAQAEATHVVLGHLVDGLRYLQDLKLMSSAEPDIPQAHRDSVWRGADTVQSALEIALGHLSQVELDAWKDSRN